MSVSGIITDHAFQPHPDLPNYCGCGAALYLHASEDGRARVDAIADETAEILRENAEMRRDLGLDDTEESPPAEGWRIRDLDELNRVLGRMARLQRLRGENEHVVAAEVNRLGEWLEKEDQALEKRYRDLEAHVYEFARDNREALGKTRRLPNGVVSWRERKEGAYRWRQDMTKAEAEAALLKWAREAEVTLGTELIYDVEKPDLDAIKRTLAALDEGVGGAIGPDRAPPGLEWVGPGESLSIVVGGKKP